MAFTQDEWREIQNLVNRIVTDKGEPFVQGKVVKSNQQKKLVWLKEFGDTPIPVIGFDYQVKYNVPSHSLSGDTISGYSLSSRTQIKKTQAHSPDVEILVPRPGDIVLIAQHLGSRRLPKCIGVVKGRDFTVAE